jgi:hypothetical protein
MSTVEAFFTGMMAAWMPSLVILAWILGRAPHAASGEEPIGRQSLLSALRRILGFRFQ